MLGLAYKSDEQYAQSIEQLKAAVMLSPLDDRRAHRAPPMR